ncbi:Purple acid phosphatase, partial [Operophtera brumata]
HDRNILAFLRKNPQHSVGVYRDERHWQSSSQRPRPEKSLPYLQKEVNGLFNAPGLVNAPVMGVILHVGDFAYDMDSDNARVGDQFMRQIECVAAKVPYMTSPGNHEQAYNFSNYRARFNMPGIYSSVFYSFNLGPVHFVSISTEVYYFPQYGPELIGRQCEWLENDLAKANLPENRYDQRSDHDTRPWCLRPWIVVFGHRPMYCSNFDAECLLELTRCGLEPLMFKFGVDFVIWAHEHSYERTWPLYDNKVYNGSYEQPYSPNPQTPAAWSAFRSTAYGYTRFTAYNHTHVYIQQEDVELNCTVIDSFWVVKDSHAAYNITSN